MKMKPFPTYLYKTQLWKWATLFILGTFGALALYGINYDLAVVYMPDNIIAKPIVIVAACCAMLGCTERELCPDQKETEITFQEIRDDEN